MSRWFRHYAGMMRDDKLVRVALKSKQTVERVTWVWGAILESAAEIDDGGRYELDAAEVAYFLRADEGDIAGIVECMQQLGRLSEGCVVHWRDRQFQSDRSAERVRAHRERKRSEDNRGSGGRLDNGCNELAGETVTLQERHRNSPETETETERTVAEATVARAAPKNDRRLVLDAFEGVISPERAAAVVDHRRGIKSPLTPHAAALLAKQFAKWSSPDDAADMMIARGWRGFEPAWAERDARASTGPPRQAKRNTALDGLDELERRFSANVQQPHLRIAG